MIKILFIVLYAVMLAFPASAKESPQHTQQLEQLINDMMNEFAIPGMAVGIVNKDGPIYMKGFGVRGVDAKGPVTPDTQFAIGSTSKAFTATAAGILVDRGTIQWDEPIKKSYLPDFELFDPLATQLVTMRDLLCHRTGLPRHDLVWYGTPFSRRELYERLRYLEPTRSIREVSQYQNLMFMTAGYLVGQQVGMTWEEFTQANILDKIGMNNTTFSEAGMKSSPDYAIPHFIKDGQAFEIPFRNLDAVAPAGSMNSSVRDMGKWIRLQLNRGTLDDEDVISAHVIDEIHKPQILSNIMGFENFLPELEHETYALGWFHEKFNGETLIHHGGGIDGFITFVGFLPEKDLGLVIFANTNSIAPYFAGYAYLDMVTSGKMGPWLERFREFSKQPKKVEKKITNTPIAIEDYVGTYNHPGYGEFRINIHPQKNHLTAERYSQEIVLGHVKDHRFAPVDGSDFTVVYPMHETANFVVDDNGEVKGFHIRLDTIAPPIYFSKEPEILSWQPEGQQINANQATIDFIERLKVF